jgi:geranylgeranyl diphosphate synthase type II
MDHALSQDPNLEMLRLLVESRLRASLSSLGEGCPPILREAMEYSLLAPGKRLRPLLVLLATEACGGDRETGMPAACAVEMIHVYSLIHDDLPAMDDDDLRRGQPTSHKRFGEALAILAGDALLTLAFGVLSEAYLPITASACCRELARAAGASGMVGGQVDDLLWEKQGGCLEELESLHDRKTGALFQACLRLGLWVAQGERPEGPAKWVQEALDRFGRCFGLAFQITDDLLDVESSSELAGKRVGKDAAKGKLTYPGFLGTEESRARAERLGCEARAHLVPLGPAGERLAGMVGLVLKRDR